MSPIGDYWKKFRFVLELAEASAEGKQSTVSPSSYAIDEVFHENIFMKAFLHNMILRPSCYKCKARSGSSGSDITIADFWGIEQILPSMDDDRGTSLVVVNTSKGKYALDDVSSMMKTVVTDFQGAISNNPSWNESSYCHPSRSVFFRRLNKSHDIIELIKIELTREQRISLRHRIKQSLKRVFLCGWIKRFFDR